MDIAAFVGHSFIKEDEPVVAEILKFLTALQAIIPEFSWDHAEAAEPKDLSAKVLDKIKDKNLFIGICTARERVVSPQFLQTNFFFRKMLFAPTESFKVKTSDWVIQEIGLAKGIALGRGTDFPIILLIEEGLRPPGGLQGDVEFINFSRDSIASTFPKILEMITSLRPRLAQVGRQQEAEPPASEDAPNRKRDGTPRDDWSLSNYVDALFFSILDNDDSTESKILDAFNKSELAKDAKSSTDFQSEKLFIDHLLRERDVAAELRALTTNHPTNRSALKRLAEVYERQEQIEQAAKLYSDLFDFGESNAERIHFAAKAAVRYLELGKTCEAEEQSLRILSISSLAEPDQIEVLKATAKIAKAKGNALVFCALAEGALGRQPDNNGLRFDLAFQYGELKWPALAAKHYRILCKKDPSEAHWNNLGVAYSTMGLGGLGVDAYHSSQSLGGTLAISNLARKLLAAGFFVQAEETCRAVVSKPECDKAVASALVRVEESRTRERKELETALAKTQAQVDFFNRASSAALTPQPLEARYDFLKNGVLYSIQVSGITISSTFSFEKQVEGLMAALLRSDKPLPPKKYKTTLTGTLCGKLASFEERTTEDNDLTTLLTEKDPSRGILFFSDDMSKVEYFYSSDSATRVDFSAKTEL